MRRWKVRCLLALGSKVTMRNLGGPGLQEAQSALKSRFLLEDPATDRPAALGKSLLFSNDCGNMGKGQGLHLHPHHEHVDKTLVHTRCTQGMCSPSWVHVGCSCSLEIKQMAQAART